MKKLFNLLIYVVLIFTVFIIPVNTSAFSIDFSNIFNSQSDEPNTMSVPNNVSLIELDDSNHQFSLAVDSSRKLTADEVDQVNIDVIVENPEGKQKTYQMSDLNIEVTDENLRRIYKVPLIEDSFTSGYGQYKYTLNAKFLNESLTLEQSTFNTYRAFKSNGLSREQVTTELIPIYFSSVDGKYSIPVYTQMATGKNYFRRVVNTMNSPVSLAGISEQTGFPSVSGMKYTAGVFSLFINSANLAEFNLPERANLTAQNLIKSFEVQNRDLTVNSIVLFVDNSTKSTAFGGIDISQPFVINRLSKVYLPYVDGDTQLWIPFDLKESEGTMVLVKQIINGYQNPMTLFKDKKFVPTLPDTVVVESTQIVANTLKIYFNLALIEHFNGQTEYAKSFIEGLALSVTTLPFIDNFEIYVGEQKITNLGGYTFEVPIERPDYFNVNPTYIK